MRMNKITYIKSLLQQEASTPKEKQAVFYKTGIGDYAEKEQFIGVKVPILRKIAKNFQDLTLAEIQIFIGSPINEERLFALFILINQYQKAQNDNHHKDQIYKFYMCNLKHVNNWNLVDSSAHTILGAHLFHQNNQADPNILFTLARSKVIWERRIAIISTWYFIRNNDFEFTFKLAEMLINDKHDLIHKAVGWMLREAGKRNQSKLVAFLEKHVSHMPRTMLRYSIEKLQQNLKNRLMQ